MLMLLLIIAPIQFLSPWDLSEELYQATAARGDCSEFWCGEYLADCTSACPHYHQVNWVPVKTYQQQISIIKCPLQSSSDYVYTDEDCARTSLIVSWLTFSHNLWPQMSCYKSTNVATKRVCSSDNYSDNLIMLSAGGTILNFKISLKSASLAKELLAPPPSTRPSLGNTLNNIMHMSCPVNLSDLIY